MVKSEPLNNFRFIVEIDGIQQTGFSEVIMPEIITDVIEYREGSDLNGVRKLGGLTRYSNLRLRYGVTADADTGLYDWLKSVVDNGTTGNRRNVSVILMGADHEPVARWLFDKAWPVRYQVSDLNAQTSEPVIETIDLAFDSFRKESL